MARGRGFGRPSNCERLGRSGLYDPAWHGRRCLDLCRASCWRRAPRTLAPYLKNVISNCNSLAGFGRDPLPDGRPLDGADVITGPKCHKLSRNTVRNCRGSTDRGRTTKHGAGGLAGDVGYECSDGHHLGCVLAIGPANQLWSRLLVRLRRYRDLVGLYIGLAGCRDGTAAPVLAPHPTAIGHNINSGVRTAYARKSLI